MKLMTPEDIYKSLDDVVAGQERAKKVLANALFLHSVRSTLSDLNRHEAPLRKTTVLLTGPTGCGKTYLVDNLAAIAKLPVMKINAKSISNTGYVGKDIETFLKVYVNEHKRHPKVTQGICFIDEVDKICIEHSSSQWNASVQHSLLRFIEGSEYNFSSQRDLSNVSFNTSGMFMVLAGSFAHYEDIKDKTKGQIGFAGESAEQLTMEEAPHVELVKAGMVREMAGRISRVARLDPLNKEDLKEIMLRKENSIYKQYKKVFAFLGEELVLQPDQIDRIIDKAIESKSGARGLQAYLEEELESRIFHTQLNLMHVNTRQAESEARSILGLKRGDGND